MGKLRITILNIIAMLLVLVTFAACISGPSQELQSDSNINNEDIDATIEASIESMMKELELSKIFETPIIISATPEIQIVQEQVEVIKLVETIKEIILPTQTPQPTFTPYPTYTPYPTPTIAPTINAADIFVEEPGCLPRPDVDKLNFAVSADDSITQYSDTPLQKSGTVMIDGVTAKQGTIITAYYDPPFMPIATDLKGYLAGYTTVDARGRYAIDLFSRGTSTDHDKQSWRNIFFKIDNCYTRESTWKSYGTGISRPLNLTATTTLEHERPSLPSRIMVNDYAMNSNYFISADATWDLSTNVVPVSSEGFPPGEIEFTAKVKLLEWGFNREFEYTWTGVDKTWGLANEKASVVVKNGLNNFITLTISEPKN
jgi:hypothetical protein